MKISLLCSCVALASALTAASPELLAQHGGGRGGGFGGGMGGPMGGGFGNGMPTGMQRGTPGTATSPERSSGMQSSERAPGSDLQSNERGGARTPAQLLQQNTKLAEGLAKLLPAGTDLQSAASGFRNLGEFVAAVHVSSNLGIPFADLKTKLMAGDSLGEAINALRPSTDGLVEARKARSQADDDLAKG